MHIQSPRHERSIESLRCFVRLWEDARQLDHPSHGLIRVQNRMTGDQAKGTLMGKTVCSFLRLGRPFPTESRCLTLTF